MCILTIPSTYNMFMFTFITTRWQQSSIFLLRYLPNRSGTLRLGRTEEMRNEWRIVSPCDWTRSSRTPRRTRVDLSQNPENGVCQATSRSYQQSPSLLLMYEMWFVSHASLHIPLGTRPCKTSWRCHSDPLLCGLILQLWVWQLVHLHLRDHTLMRMWSCGWAPLSWFCGSDLSITR